MVKVKNKCVKRSNTRKKQINRTSNNHKNKTKEKKLG